MSVLYLLLLTLYNKQNMLKCIQTIFKGHLFCMSVFIEQCCSMMSLSSLLVTASVVEWLESPTSNPLIQQPLWLGFDP